MADVKVSGLPNDTSLDGNHYVLLNDPTGPTTKRTLLSTLAAYFFDQVNQPSGATGGPVQRAVDTWLDCVISGGIWTGDAYASTRNASMTALVVMINGRRISIGAVTARTFTASKDTYVDVLDNGDGTGTLVYTEVANGATTGFTLAANSIRIAKVVTGASNIAAASSIVQGGQDAMGYVFYPKSNKMLQQNQCILATGNAAPGTTAPTFSSGVGASAAFNEAAEELYDPAGMHDISTNNTRVTINVPGVYEVIANIGWNDSSTGVRIMDIYKNGVATFLGGARQAQDSDGRRAHTASVYVTLAKGDYLELSIFQNIGSTVGPNTMSWKTKLVG